MLAGEETGHVLSGGFRTLSTGIGLLVLEPVICGNRGYQRGKLRPKEREDAGKCQASFLVDVIEYSGKAADAVLWRPSVPIF